MGATNRFQLLVESQSKGEAEISRLNSVVNKLAADIEKANKRIAVSSTGAQREFSSSASKIAKDASVTGSTIQNSLSSPLQTLTAKLSGGTGAMALFAGGVAGITVGIGAAGISLKSFVQEASEAAFEIRGLSASTGLTIGATDKLRAVAKLSGFDIRNLQEAALDLSQALKDTSGQGETSRRLLRQLGISAYETTGQTRSLGDVFTDVLGKLAKVENITDRVNLSRVLGGEDAAKKSQLLISQYDELNRKAVQLGFGARDGLLKSLEESNRELKLIDLQWESLKAKFAEKIAPITVTILTRVLKLADGDLSALPGAAFQREAQLAQDEVLSKAFPSIDGSFLGRFQPTAKPFETRLAEQERLGASFRSGQLGSEDGIKLRLTQIAKDRAELALRLSSGSLSSSTFKELSGKLYAFTAEQLALDRQLAFIAKARAGAELIIDTSIGAPGVPKAGVPTLGPRRGRDGFLILPGTSLGAFVSREEDRSKFASSTVDPSARVAGQQAKDKRDRELNESFARRFVEFEERKVELLTGPGGELAAINQIYELKKAGLEQELQYGTEIFNLSERRLQIEQERTLSILNLQRQRRDEARGLASDFVGSIQGGDPKSFFRQQGGRLINQVGTNVLTGTFQRVQSTLGRFGASTGLGSLLGGTILDPANATPLDKTAAATERTAVATERIAASVSGGIPGTGGSLRGFDAIRALGPASGFTGGFSSTLGQITGGAASVLSPGGLFAGLRPDGSIQLGNGRATTAQGLGLNTTASRTANVAGSIAALGAGTLTAIRGFQQGGLSGITQGITASLGTAALIPGPQQPFIAAAAATAALVSMLLPDPKKARDRAINRQLEDAYYAEASPLAYNFDQMGYGYDTNKRGDMRQDVTIVVQTMDARSFADNREMITDAVRQSVYEGHSLNRAMRETLMAA